MHFSHDMWPTWHSIWHMRTAQGLAHMVCHVGIACIEHGCQNLHNPPAAAGLLSASSAAPPEVSSQLVRWLLTPIATEWGQPGWQAKVATPEAFVQVAGGAVCGAVTCYSRWQGVLRAGWQCLGSGMQSVGQVMQGIGQATSS